MRNAHGTHNGLSPGQVEKEEVKSDGRSAGEKFNDFRNAGQDVCCAAREMTIGELLDRRIEKAATLLRTLQDLKGALSGQFLSSGASRISALIEF
jgi:hypothetical protein